MGVKNLWKLLSPCGHKASMENKTLAVDTNIWMHQYSGLPNNVVIFSLCRRLFRILYTKIKPVFIFDGTPTVEKQKTLEERRKTKERMLLRRYLLNKTCEICNLKIGPNGSTVEGDTKTCQHYKEYDNISLEDINKKAFERLKGHSFDWGELSDESELEEYFSEGIRRFNRINFNEDISKTDNSSNTDDPIVNSTNTDDHIIGANNTNDPIIAANNTNDPLIAANNTNDPLIATNTHPFNECIEVSPTNCTDNKNHFADNSIADFDESRLHNLSKVKQLEILSDLRFKRRFPMHCDGSNSMNFSRSQIENVRKRNKITSLIRNLNKEKERTIQSDSRTHSVLIKENEPQFGDFNIFSNYVYKEKTSEEVSNTETIKTSNEVESCEIEDLFEVQHIPSVEIKKAHHKEDGDINLRINLNKALAMELNETKESHLPIFEAEESPTQRESPVELHTSDFEGSKQDDQPSDSSQETFFISSDDKADSTTSSIGLPETVEAIGKKGRSICQIVKPKTEQRRIQELIIEVLKVFEIPFIEATGETDTQCWELFKEKLINGVISDDSDMIIYGTTVYRNFFRKDKEIQEFTMEEVERRLGLTQDDLIKISYLVGSDYCTGRKGVGIKKALQEKENITDEEVEFLNRIYKGNYSTEKSKDVEQAAPINLSKSVDEKIPAKFNISFGKLNLKKFRTFLVKSGVDHQKIEELMLYHRKVKELLEEE